MPEFDLSAVKVNSDSEAIHRARRDYAVALGLVIYPQWICGYIGDSDSTTDLLVEFKIGVKIIPTPADSIARFCDEYCDPIWDVEIVDDPNNYASNIRSPWIYGQSYETPKPQRSRG